MHGICKGPSDLTWLYRLPKTWHVWGKNLGTKATNSYESSKSWCTSGIYHHERPNVNTDGKFLQMGHWLVYGRYMTYTTGTPAKKYKWPCWYVPGIYNIPDIYSPLPIVVVIDQVFMLSPPYSQEARWPLTKTVKEPLNFEGWTDLYEIDHPKKHATSWNSFM